MRTSSSLILLSLLASPAAFSEELQGGKASLGTAKSSVASVNKKNSGPIVQKTTPIDNVSKNSGPAPEKSIGSKNVGSTNDKSAAAKSTESINEKANGSRSSGSSNDKSAGLKSTGSTNDKSAGSKSTESTNNKSSGSKSAGSTSDKGNGSQSDGAKAEKPAATKHSHRKSNSNNSSMLVPPPPPSVPTMTEMGMQGMNTQMIFMGENVEYMPAAELRELKTKTDADIAKARRIVEEYASTAKDAKQKAESFDQLFAEGVVSRRELEASKHDNEKNAQDLIDAKQTLSMLEQKYLRIEKRLEELNKAKKSSNSNVSIKKKPRH